MDDPWTTVLTWDGGLTLLAPLVAVALALMTRRVVPSLAAAVVTGAVVAARGSISDALFTLADVIREVTLSTDNLTVSAFSILVAATVGIMGRSGGTRALVSKIEGLARGRRGAMIATWLSGGVVFFDDYANCLVVGSAMGPVCDRSRVSRAKLAYIVDSTAAPIASLAIVSTWVGYEVGLFRDALAIVAPDAGAFTVFLQALPYRFYCIFTLIFVGAIAITGRDFGAMAQEEAAALNAPPPEEEQDTGAVQSAWLAAAPVIVLVLITFSALWFGGWRALGADAGNAAFFEVIGAADPFRAMLYGSATAFLVACGLALSLRAMTPADIPDACWGAVRTVMQALVVLYLAWTLGAVIKQTGAAHFIAGGLQGRLPPQALPALVFVLAAATSFSTGSSFFTMGALIPLVLPLAVELGGDAGGGVILFASAAAVLDGAVLGDHASPISDTTILSSLGSSCDLVTHVRTQLPYALTVGVIAILLGCLPAGVGFSPWILIVLGGLMAVAVVRFVGRLPAGQRSS